MTEDFILLLSLSVHQNRISKKVIPTQDAMLRAASASETSQIAQEARISFRDISGKKRKQQSMIVVEVETE
jgi:hypothetical protein